MSQATLDDDALFGEAATELTTNVRDHLDTAWAELPEAEQIWTVEADNVLGVLNTLRSTLDVDAAAEHVREAKKWYMLGDRADAFASDDTIIAEVEELDATVERISTLRELVGDAASELPAVRTTLLEHADDHPDTR